MAEKEAVRRLAQTQLAAALSTRHKAPTTFLEDNRRKEPSMIQPVALAPSMRVDYQVDRMALPEGEAINLEMRALPCQQAETGRLCLLRDAYGILEPGGV